MYACIYIYTHIYKYKSYTCVCVYMYVYMFIHVSTHICMYIFICPILKKVALKISFTFLLKVKI